MAYRIFARVTRGRVLAATSTLGAAGLVGTQLGGKGSDDMSETAAEIQFHTSFWYSPHGLPLIKLPEDWKGRIFQIRNDYPKPLQPKAQGAAATQLPPMPGPDRPLPSIDPLDDAPWLNIDFKEDPLRYARVIKEYCWEGNLNAKEEFVLQKNQVRNWYHAPWMHWSANGREPLNGLTFERATPPKELASTQDRLLQTWACGFYNETGARTFGEIWADPNNPQWNKFQFPLGTCVFKILLTTATDKEVRTMKDSPKMHAVISPEGSTQGTKRNDHASELRLLQIDFAVRDCRADIGWVFGTFMYNGDMKNNNPWDRLMPVGIMWGNDPKLTPTAYSNGEKPEESWINPEADALRKSLGGTRTTWGFDGRMNGPADYFRSACASCHSTSSRDTYNGLTFDYKCLNLKTQKERDACEALITDAQKMLYFRNLKKYEAFTDNDVSGDYSLQLQMGYYNHKVWCQSKKSLFYRTKLKFPGLFKEAEEARIAELKRAPLRAVGMPPEEEE